MTMRDIEKMLLTHNSICKKLQRIREDFGEVRAYERLFELAVLVDMDINDRIKDFDKHAPK